MRMARFGSGDPALVFVHGLACDGTDWAAQVTSLASRSTVVVCELPGHGSSPGTPAQCSIEAYGAALARGVADLGVGPAILVGHSMGCRVVLQACRVEPTAVSGLVLLDGSRIADGDPQLAERAMADELAGDGYRSFMRRFFESMLVSDPVLAESITARGLRLPPELGRGLVSGLAGWDAGEVPGALDAVGVPMLAIQATTMDTSRQRVSMSAGRRSPWLDLIRAHVPGAEVAVLTGSGHFPQIEKADDVSALIADFARRR